MSLLQTVDLCRSFGEIRAVDQLSMTVRSAVMTGFVGANGAGKTTTMRMVVGVLEPTSGQVLWDGHSITTRVRRQIGYMPEERGLYLKQPVIDQLVYLGTLKGYTTNRVRVQVMEYLERFGLADRAKDKLTELSLGNQQRAQIAAALVHDPEVLILDEPFSGLDPLAVDVVADLVPHLRAVVLGLAGGQQPRHQPRGLVRSIGLVESPVRLRRVAKPARWRRRRLGERNRGLIAAIGPEALVLAIRQ